MKFKSLVFAGLLLFVASAGVAQAKEESDAAVIFAMVEKAMAKDPAADVTWLRRENSRRFSYMLPAWESGAKAYEAFDSDPAKAFGLARKQLELNPLDIDANALAEVALSKLGRKDEEARHHNLLMAMLDSISGGKDGQSQETAWNAVSVDEEYQILRLVRHQPTGQALVRGAAGTFDAMTVINGRTGKERTIYFSIDFFFGKQFEGLGL